MKISIYFGCKKTAIKGQLKTKMFSNVPLVYISVNKVLRDKTVTFHYVLVLYNYMILITIQQFKFYVQTKEYVLKMVVYVIRIGLEKTVQFTKTKIVKVI